MGKIAVESRVIPMRPDGEAVARPARRLLARDEGWSATEERCTAGPRDRSFEEQFSKACIAIVAAGTFQYRSSAGRELMTPGSLLLGHAGQSFECSHEHGVGDRCISFSYSAEYFEQLMDEAGVRGLKPAFASLRVPPIRELSRVVARACGLAAHGESTDCLREAASRPSSGRPPQHAKTRVVGDPGRWRAEPGLADWEAIAIDLAASALVFAAKRSLPPTSPAAEARVTRVVRMIEQQPDLKLSLAVLAREARLSRFHFLRIFQQLTGLSPHQYILRARLRRAATLLLLDGARVVDVALDSGFGDISNFNHAFHAEFGVAPTSYRKRPQ